MIFPPLLASYCSPKDALDIALYATEAELFAVATALREASFGSSVELCAIINARNGNCSMDCSFCAQSTHNACAIEVFPMLSAESLRSSITALAEQKVRHIGIVTSGAALQKQELSIITQVLKDLPPDIVARVCGSLGRLPLESLQSLRSAGMRRFHHNLESEESYYPRICTTQRWQDRLHTIHRARQAGLEICTGGLLGLGESWEDRIAFAMRLRDEGIDNVPINFLHPHKGTPLADRPVLSEAEALRCIALWRCILPTATLRVCGGRPVVLRERQHDIFAAGANALMTGNYLTTAGKSLEADVAMIARAGLKLTC